MVLAVWTVPEWLTFPIYGNVVNVLESDVPASAPGRMLTEDELSLYNGEKNSKGLFLTLKRGGNITALAAVIISLQ
ncbi:hypothetical protein M9458_011698, partial [Cirrhinus mrigala]